MNLLAMAVIATLGVVPDSQGEVEVPSLNLRVAKGDRWIYSTRQSFIEQGAKEPDTVLLFHEVHVVLDANVVELQMEQVLSFLGSIEGGQRLPAPKSAEPAVWRTKWQRNGLRANAEQRFDDSVRVRLDRLSWILGQSAHSEVRTTRKWDVTIASGASDAIPTIVYNFAYLNDAEQLGRSCAKVRYSVRELDFPRPIAGEGTAWIDRASGVLLKLEGEFKGALLPGGSGELYDLKLEICAESLQLGGKEVLSKSG